MELRHMRYIITIAEYGSITKAAEVLYTTQPSLSHCVAKAEQELNVKLFDRSTSPMTLTYAGETFVRRARQMLELNQTMEREFRDISANRTGRLRIGFPHERAPFMLPEILPLFRREYPGMDLQIMTAGSAQLREALDKGRIDFYIAPFDGKVPSYEAIPVASEELVFAAARNTIAEELCLKEDPSCIDLSKTAGLQYNLLKKGHSIRNTMEDLFAKAGIRPEHIAETTSNLTALRLACAGVGIAIVPEMTLYITDRADGIDVFHIGKDPVVWQICGIFRTGTYIGTVERRFLAIAAEAYNQIKEQRYSSFFRRPEQ